MEARGVVTDTTLAPRAAPRDALGAPFRGPVTVPAPWGRGDLGVVLDRPLHFPPS